MLKILLADDEGIVLEALKFIIENEIKEPYILECAKTGRQVIEIAERFRPDIAFMDIQMPGINGVKAMQEIRKTNKDVIFIVVSAFEKFDYAKDAIAIGVLDYLNKPILKDRVLEVLHKAIDIVKINQKKRASELEIQEKLETVLPIIEAGMIYSILFQKDSFEDVKNYLNLLGIEQSYGSMMVVRFGDSNQKGHLTNSIGSAVKSQQSYEKLRGILVEYTNGVVGPVMGNNVIIFVPTEEEVEEYETRIKSIDHIREMVRILKSEMESEFRVGIGSVHPIREVESSYQEALEALRESESSVAHISDLTVASKDNEDYPIQNEKRLFTYIENGDKAQTVGEMKTFFEWMRNVNGTLTEDMKIRCLEFVLRAEFISNTNKGRSTYLRDIVEMETFEELESWMETKMSQAAEHVNAKKKEAVVDVVEKAKEYIEKNYRDVSLDNVSRDLNMSPYYFSKLFKEKVGENFIDYVSDFKIAKAKEMIRNNEKSMKEICVDIGYSNPNYFSYIFKKKVGVTPSEFREGLD